MHPSTLSSAQIYNVGIGIPTKSIKDNIPLLNTWREKDTPFAPIQPAFFDNIRVDGA